MSIRSSKSAYELALLMILAIFLALFTMYDAIISMIGAPSWTQMAIEGGLLLMSVLLFIAIFGIARRSRWGQLLGIIGFFGIVIFQFLPAILGYELIGGIVTGGFATVAGLYLLFASEEFGSNSTNRNIDAEGSHEKIPW